MQSQVQAEAQKNGTVNEPHQTDHKALTFVGHALYNYAPGAAPASQLAGPHEAPADVRAFCTRPRSAAPTLSDRPTGGNMCVRQQPVGRSIVGGYPRDSPAGIHAYWDQPPLSLLSGLEPPPPAVRVSSGVAAAQPPPTALAMSRPRQVISSQYSLPRLAEPYRPSPPFDPTPTPAAWPSCPQIKSSFVRVTVHVPSVLKPFCSPSSHITALSFGSLRQALLPALHDRLAARLTQGGGDSGPHAPSGHIQPLR